MGLLPALGHPTKVVCTQAVGAARANPDLLMSALSRFFFQRLRSDRPTVPEADFDMLATFKSSLMIIAWFF